jgi:hypothetical protein
MTPIEDLQNTLNGLGLKAVEARLESLLEQASKKEPSYADFLAELLGCDVDARRSLLEGRIGRFAGQLAATRQRIFRKALRDKFPNFMGICGPDCSWHTCRW